jgi:hypothetical protein
MFLAHTYLLFILQVRGNIGTRTVEDHAPLRANEK